MVGRGEICTEFCIVQNSLVAALLDNFESEFGVQHKKEPEIYLGFFFVAMAGTTGLEPATSSVTSSRSIQLNYVPKFAKQI